MNNNRRTYTPPMVKVVCGKPCTLLSGSNYINTASRDYDGRAVLSRAGRFSTLEEENCDE